ncbi:MAG: NADH-quinone oxidoreductase subunit L [Sphingomonadaceae bacterium]|uniref:NADH-quinone oxidoreductase subunit L n=1 Tax=Thermaurantiacus sp. TaxID=2820283 RepID=UPI00298F1CFC|nr:NADH-quinone oxidoreductase subunit L [Thermaurantiacus sp.]MCS6986681.1 NADH-quinone oxidoreductase subunit L [Sphingomonadaceae bacterium]MDW8414056.1 NADH-quinone oxidoreductase subunit L [Thermaurantiacus sp.]
MVQAIVLLPLLGFLVAGIGNRALGDLGARLVTTIAVGVACALAWLVFLRQWEGEGAYVVTVAEWFSSGALRVSWQLRVDMLVAVMLVVVTTVSALVHLYSWGYMAEDSSQPRFFAYLSLFTFAMLMLVTAESLVQLFFGWEGVGLASYLLIGFWYERPAAKAAAIKAFVVNRVGDFGFMLGLFAAFLVFGTLDLSDMLAAVPRHRDTTIELLGTPVDALTAIALLLFVGAMGKSAQLGLHTWLPDAMEGPTPVSALIHAATMVTAGVFLVCRLSPLFEAAPLALDVVTYLGAATALFAATVATTQHDIKRVIAYSTCSQLGFMFFAAGIGAYGAAMFHLFTHAFFKALLFLGAGSVIHAMHHEQDMRRYGGLARHVPLTFAAMTVGTLAITGFFFTAGYYSKDGILFSAFARGREPALVAFAVGLVTALLTSFYSWRLVFLTFFGAPRWDGHHHAPHESPPSMLVPLGVLALGALGAGALFHEAYIGAHHPFWQGAIVHDRAFAAAAHDVPALVHWAPAIAMAAGFLIALRQYVLKPGAAEDFVRTFHTLHGFFYRKWYFDELYDALFVRPARALGRMFWQGGDLGLIDRLGPDGVSAAVGAGASAARRFQSGLLQAYAMVMLVGVAGLVTWLLAAR